jgi:hypothetical protein
LKKELAKMPLQKIGDNLQKSSANLDLTLTRAPYPWKREHYARQRYNDAEHDQWLGGAEFGADRRARPNAARTKVHAAIRASSHGLSRTTFGALIRGKRGEPQ